MKKTNLLFALVMLFAIGSAFVSKPGATGSTVYFKKANGQFEVKDFGSGSCLPAPDKFCTYWFIGQGSNIPVSQEPTDYQADTNDPGQWVQ